MSVDANPNPAPVIAPVAQPATPSTLSAYSANAPTAWAFALLGIIVIGTIVLSAMTKTVPAELWQLAFLLGGGGAGAAVSGIVKTL